MPGSFVNDARKTQNRNIIVASVRVGANAVTGKSKEAKRVFRKMVSSVKDIANTIPVIGHVKGIVHYVTGDTEHGHYCIIKSTRLAAVLGAGALFWDLGLRVAVIIAFTALVMYDLAVTVIGKRPYGFWNAAKESYENFYSALENAYKIGKIVKTVAAQVKERVRATIQRYALTNKVGKEATQNLVDAASELNNVTKDVHGDNHVCTKAKNLDTGNAEYGFNERCRQQLRVKRFKEKGEASGYRSRSNAKKGHADEFPRALGVLEKAAKEQNIKISPIRGRSPQACAEHHAFNKLGTHGGANNVSTSSVIKTAEEYKAVERCGNCKQYGDLMGEVPSDQIHGMLVPTKESSSPVTIEIDERLDGVCVSVGSETITFPGPRDRSKSKINVQKVEKNLNK